ncbi:MAG: hypothetical protein ACM3PP_09710 [Candidatus Saccharibacteria bacterium]
MGGLNINKRRFMAAGSLGFIALVTVLVTLMMTGSVYAAFPLAGVGGFVVEATKIAGNGFDLVPNLHDTNISNNYQEVRPWLGQAEARIDDLNTGTNGIDGLHLYKNIDVTHISPVLFGACKYMQVCVDASQQVKGTNVVMDAQRMEIGKAVFNNMIMDENLSYRDLAHTKRIKNAEIHLSSENMYASANAISRSKGLPNAGPYLSANGGNATPTMGAEIGIAADSFVLDNAKINAHFLKADQMIIPGLTLSIKYMTQDNQEINLGNYSDPRNIVMEQDGSLAYPPKGALMPWEL